MKNQKSLKKNCNTAIIRIIYTDENNINDEIILKDEPGIKKLLPNSMLAQIIKFFVLLFASKGIFEIDIIVRAKYLFLKPEVDECKRNQSGRATAKDVPDLTNREKQVTHCKFDLAMNQKEIAAFLEITIAMVKGHVTNANIKFNTDKSKTDAQNNIIVHNQWNEGFEGYVYVAGDDDEV